MTERKKGGQNTEKNTKLRPPWRKGQSGNPGGRPKVIAQVRDLARQQTEAAIETLAKIMKNAKAAPSARIAAANALLDRGWGRAPQHVTVNRSPLEDVDPATLTALEQALAEAEPAGAERPAGRDEAGTVH